MLTVLVAGLFLLMSTLEMVRTRVPIRVGGNPAQALQDLAQVRQYVSGNSLFAFFDAPWTPICLLVAYLIHPLPGLLTLIGSLILVAWLISRKREQTRKEINASTCIAIEKSYFTPEK